MTTVEQQHEDPSDTAVDEAGVLVWPPVEIGAVIGFGWGDCADQDAWAALVGWVDWFLSTYDLLEDERLLPCWPDHPGVVEELAALWMAWCESARKSREGDGDALAYWHDRYLSGVWARLPMYKMRQCRERHEIGVRPRLTDTSLVSVRETAVSLTDLDDDVAVEEAAEVDEHPARQG